MAAASHKKDSGRPGNERLNKQPIHKQVDRSDGENKYGYCYKPTTWIAYSGGGYFHKAACLHFKTDVIGCKYNNFFVNNQIRLIIILVITSFLNRKTEFFYYICVAKNYRTPPRPLFLKKNPNQSKKNDVMHRSENRQTGARIGKSYANRYIIAKVYPLLKILKKSGGVKFYQNFFATLLIFPTFATEFTCNTNSKFSGRKLKKTK